ncbi:MAG TPA: hypothetical protein VEB65_04355 [Solirubrobacterales bacterium]|nr:hypothetical protein [Solirubrobacterales bacterium]
MSRFDERAEASVERGPGKKGPSRDEIKKVRKALSTNHRRLEDDLTSIDVLLNLAPVQAGNIENGPPPPGTFSNSEAVRFMGRVADDIRQIRSAVSAVDFDAGDKQKFRLALAEMAKAWDLRAEALATPDSAGAEAIGAQVTAAEQRADAAKKGLARYFPEVDVEAEEERKEHEEEEQAGGAPQ